MVVALFLVHEYSFGPVRAKGRPLAGLWVFAQVVAFPFFFAAWIEPDLPLLHAVANVLFIPWGEPGSGELAHQAQRIVGMMAFLTGWFLAKGTFKNVPDYHGDRAAGLRTSATYFNTWRGAALAATLATVLAYLSLLLVVVLGLEKPLLLLALVWLVPVTWNCVRLLKTEDGGQGNRYLKTDMGLSMGFISSVLLLLSPRWESLASIVIGALIILGSDLLNVDSRREADVREASAGTASARS
jgi:4-hydroxybenzoate polyprenyltransferase